MPEKLDPEHKSLIIYNKLVECRVALRCTSQFSSKTLDLKSGTIICLLDCIAYTKGSKEGNNTDGFLIRVLAPTGDVMCIFSSYIPKDFRPNGMGLFKPVNLDPV